MAGIPYYSIVPCCSSSGTALGYFNLTGGVPLSPNGTYAYTGPTVTVNGLTFTSGYCYTITGVGVSLTDYPDAPAASSFTLASNCSDNLCYDCESPIPETYCYRLYSCDGQNDITTNTNLVAYENTFVSLVGETGCFYVYPISLADCGSSHPKPVVVDTNAPCECECNCYQVTGNPTSIFYIDCDLVPQTISGNSKFCSVIPPVVTGGIVGSIYNFGLCVNGQCRDLCYKFVNCTTGETLITSNTENITEYFADNAIVTLMGYEGCWSIELTEECDCPVNVTILQTYTNCQTCLPTVAYKFTNCNNTAIVQYSINDFSAYVNKSVELECGDCWLVTQIDYIPPATQVINILNVFDNCTACNRTYYKLTDCADIGNIQYTYTDLSSYLGKVIKIENCDSCFTIEETRTPVLAGIVTVTESFVDCIECGGIPPCVCTTLKNYDTTSHIYNYFDCEGVLQTITLSSGESLDKTCMRGFVGDKLCNCIELTINDVPVTAVLQPTQINGKPTWTFIYNTATFTIAYDTNEGWQILSSLVPSGFIAELNNPMLPCPNGPWTVTSNPILDLSLFLDNGQLVLNGVLTYDYSMQAYTGNIEVNGKVYAFILDVTYLSECNGFWNLAYWNTDAKVPFWETVASFPADCTCLNGTYIDVIPNNIYIEIKSICTINTVDCSVGYAAFTPSATDDLKEYGDCSLVSSTCYTYIINIPILLVPETLYYKNCKGVVISESMPATKSGYQYLICGIDGQTSNDIYITGNTPVTFEKTILCSEPIYACPPPAYPKRPVIPGYNVPSCDPAKYEKFACKSSEILYKTVLEKRYGISNCCPDTDMGERWLVKKELADLQGALDPNYTCTPTTSCCNNTPTCGCGCNSAPKTCKS